MKNTQPQDHFPGGVLDGYETETIPEPEPDFGESEYDDSDSGESDDIDSSGTDDSGGRPKTGDSGYTFYLLMLIGSAMMLTAMLAARVIACGKAKR